MTLRLVSIGFVCLATLAVDAVANAGAITNGIWVPADCGAKPEAPILDLKNEKSYNLSVEAVNAYLQKIRAYVDCLTQEANADIRTTTQSASAAQQAAAAARAKLLAEVQAAEAKLNGK